MEANRPSAGTDRLNPILLRLPPWICRSMMRFNRSLPALVLFASIAFAAPQGVVLNKTTGQPQPGVNLTLIKLSGGMENVGAAKSDAKGAFAFDKPLDAAVPYLLQAQFEGVTYNKAIPPGTPAGNVKVDVYNASAKPGDAKVVQHMVLLEPSSQGLGVNESIVFQNTGNKTYADPTGTFHFYLPDAAQGKVQVQVKGPGGMPVART